MRVGGDVDASVAPSWTSATSRPRSRVRRARIEPKRFGLHMYPYGFWWCSFVPSPSKPSSAASMSSSMDWLKKSPALRASPSSDHGASTHTDR